MLRLYALTITVSCLLLCTIAIASAPFSTVIEAPPAVLGDFESIGSNTQLNLRDGGTIGANFEAGDPDGSSSNVEVNIMGGSTGAAFRVNPGAVAVQTGGFMRGTSVKDNGSFFVRGGESEGIDAQDGSFVLVEGGAVNALSAQSGSTVRLRSGGLVRANFSTAPRSDVLITGGVIGRNIEIFGTTRVTGGSIGTEVKVSSPLGRLELAGGVVPGSISIDNQGTLEMEGGEVDVAVFIRQFSTANISGGTFGNIIADQFSNLNFRGRDFRISGMPVTGLERGESLVITTRRRGIDLTGILADGSPFSVELNPSFTVGSDLISPAATLAITQIPEPSAALMLVLSSAGTIAVWRKRQCS